MSDVVIRARGLGKKFTIGHQGPNERYTALRDVIARNASGLVRSARDILSGRQLVAGDTIEEFWALKDVDFEIRRGEVAGIIGRNGAGKSTLLKILSRITEPSVGRVEIRGRVASLLEVGTGFHPELSGRENIYLNGAILGMTRVEIKRKFDEIVAFAEVERFLDTPVKRYSSGMYVRLAFAVAAHLEPEILIVDEVLAVGDAEFQKKCLGKMQNAAGDGRTVLFVSHNMSAVQALCTKGILLNGGIVEADNFISDVVVRYMKRKSDKAGFSRSLRPSSSIYVSDGNAEYCPSENMSEAKINITLTINSNAPTSVSVDFRFSDAFGAPVAFATIGGFNNANTIELTPPKTVATIEIDAALLALGTYSIGIDVANPNIRYYDRLDDCLAITSYAVSAGDSRRQLEQSSGYGSIALPAKWVV
jgi:lipopolysaccharide transport system ATP-binding protein